MAVARSSCRLSANAESDKKLRMLGKCASDTEFDIVTLSSIPNKRNSLAVRNPRSGIRSSSLPAPDIRFKRGSSPKNKYSKFLLPPESAEATRMFLFLAIFSMAASNLFLKKRLCIRVTRCTCGQVESERNRTLLAQKQKHVTQTLKT